MLESGFGNERVTSHFLIDLKRRSVERVILHLGDNFGGSIDSLIMCLHSHAEDEQTALAEALGFDLDVAFARLYNLLHDCETKTNAFAIHICGPM